MPTPILVLANWIIDHKKKILILEEKFRYLLCIKNTNGGDGKGF